MLGWLPARETMTGESATGGDTRAQGLFCAASSHALKPLDGQFAGPPGVGPFHDSEEAVPDRLDAPLVVRIVTVNDDVAGAQFDPAANLSSEVVHRSPCHCALNAAIASSRVVQ